MTTPDPRPNPQGFLSIAMGISVLLSACALFIGLSASSALTGVAPSVNGRAAYPAFAALTFLSMRFTNAYSIGKRRLFEVGYAVFTSVIIINACMLSMPYFGIEYSVPASAVLLTAAAQGLMLAAWALGFHRLYYALNARRETLVVADTPENAAYCAAKVRAHSMELVIVAVSSQGHDPEVPERGAVVAYRLDAAAQDALYRLCADRDAALYIVPNLSQLGLYGGGDAQFGDMIALRMGNTALTPEQAALKRTFDIAASLAAIALMALPAALFALLIWLHDRHSPFFVQERLTRGGKPFGCIKLRTMVADAERDTGPTLAREGDPRVTPIGAVLRRTRLDELPQFLNVLKGEMSIVGPRPERAWFIDEYMGEVPDFGKRLAVKAGITGFAHVYGRYDTPPAERLNLDMYYILNYSFRLDIKILIDTLRIMCSRSYAEGIKGAKSL